jgi:prepilin-type N-terminal cleavage/methylation domain-containing protein
MSVAHLISKVEGRKAGSGFTLTELLVSLLVGCLVLAGVHRIFVVGLATQNTTSLQTEVNRKAQVGLDSIVSKLRGSSGVIDASASRIWLVDQEGRNCRFWLNEATLHRYCGVSSGSYSGGEHVATDVKTLQFAYRDRAGNPTTSADLVHSVIVLLEVERMGHNARLQSTVRLRNK